MPQIPSYTEKTTLADDDLFVIADSAAANATKRVKKVNLSIIPATGSWFAGLSGGTQGFKADLSSGTGNGDYTVGNIAKTSYAIGDSTGEHAFGVAGSAVVRIKSTGLLVDNITEFTPAAGVTFGGTGGVVQGPIRTIYKKIHLTSADIQTGNSVPIVALAAQGSGTTIRVMLDTTARCINGAVPATGTAMSLISDTASLGTDDQALWNSDFLASTTGNLQLSGSAATAVGNNQYKESSLLENKDLLIQFDADNPLFDGTIDIYLMAQVKTL